MIIYLYDGTEHIDLRESEGNCIHILNKMDLQLSHSNSNLLFRSDVIQISALNLEGLDKLESWLVSKASKYLCNKTDLPMLTSERQRDAMKKAADSLECFKIIKTRYSHGYSPGGFIRSA